jgi:hypothetical protein
MLITSLALAVIVTNGCISIAQGEPQQEAAPPDKQEPIEVRYARAHLALAELDLQQALQRNKRSPKVLSEATLDNLRRHVLIARQQLDQLTLGYEGDVHATFIRAAETAARNAREARIRQRQIHDKAPTASSAMELERAKAVEALAMLHLERTQARKVSDSDVYSLDWQIRGLQNQVLELQHQTIELQQDLEKLRKRR